MSTQKEKKKSSKISIAIILIGTILVSIGGFVLSYDYLLNKKIKVYEDMNYLYLEQTIDNETELDIPMVEEIEEEIEESEELESNLSNSSQTYNYIANLEIPDINLKKGLVDIKSKYNNIKYNVQIVKSSDMPDVLKGNLILAAHSGNTSTSFFGKLYKLVIGNKAYITYKGIKYEYEIVNIYKQEKTGKIIIDKDYNETTLTLVTCSYKDKKHQTIYILNLINKASI